MSLRTTPKKSGKHLHKLIQYARNRSSIIGIDGEAVTQNGKHSYMLLACANGDKSTSFIKTTHGEGLSTDVCLTFLLSLSKDACKVGFSFGYDVNMILKDLEWDLIELLHTGKYVQWKDYRLRYIPRKQFWIKRVSTGESCTIFDVFGYFQMTFYKALVDWKIGAPQEQLAIKKMKDQRNIFQLEDMSQFTEYCLNECYFLTQLTRKLFLSLDEAQLYPSKYSGAGTIAGYLMSHHQIKKYLQDNETVDRMATYGYYGGRFDLAQAGFFKETWSYDINSAYPAECLKLPCLAHGTWYQVNEYSPEYITALWNIQWSLPETSRWVPFPWREKDGNIYYTSHGQGWYWQDEIREGIKLLDISHGTWHISRGYVFHQECYHHPFSWLPDFYHLRRRYQREGNAAEKVMKLGYNSLYGKIAQTVGWEQGKKPPFQSWVWAGLITSGTRASLLAITLANPDAVLSHATDGIITTERLRYDGKTGDQLGQWKEQKEGDLWLIQPGIYEFLGEPTKSIGEMKLRGHFANEVDWKRLTKLWKDDPLDGYYDYTTHRFIGMGTALWRNEFLKVWRTWVDIPLKIYFAPRRRVGITSKSEARRTKQVTWIPRWDKGNGMSHHYQHKQTWDEQYQLMRFEKLLKMEQP